MLILLILSLILLTAVLYAQYRRSRALRRAARDLKEARMVPGTRLRLYSPDDRLEELLSQINGLLETRSGRPASCAAGRRVCAGRSPTSPTTCVPR